MERLGRNELELGTEPGQLGLELVSGRLLCLGVYQYLSVCQLSAELGLELCLCTSALTMAALVAKPNRRCMGICLELARMVGLVGARRRLVATGWVLICPRADLGGT